MLQSLRFVPLFAFGLLLGCLEPDAEVFGEPYTVTGPNGPAPDADVVQCASSTGSSCPPPRARIWMPDWSVSYVAARGTKAAFIARPVAPSEPNGLASPMYVGKLNLGTGQLEWVTRLGDDLDDVATVYAIAMTPSGHVIVVAQGYGAQYLGDGGGQYDGFLISLHSENGQTNFARRFESWDTPPLPNERPRFVGVDLIIDDDSIRACVNFQQLNAQKQDDQAAYLFSFAYDGTQRYRERLPDIQTNSYWWMRPSSDGSSWVLGYPYSMAHYSKEAKLLDSFDLPMVDPFTIRGFLPVGSTSLFVNFMDNSDINTVQRYQGGGMPMQVASFLRTDGYGAGTFMQNVSLTQSYVYEMGNFITSHRLRTIDTNGELGPTTTIDGVGYPFVILEYGIGVFVREAHPGSEWIVQAL